MLKKIIYQKNVVLNALLGQSCACCKLPVRNKLLCSTCTPAPPSSLQLRCDMCWSASTTLDGDICDICLNYPLPYKLRYLWTYEEEVRDLIAAMKYGPNINIAKFFGTTLGKSSIAPKVNDTTIVLPVPSRPDSILKRGFHQTAVMGKFALMSSQQNAKLSLTTLRASKTKPAQASLNHRERISNSVQKFYVANSQVVAKDVVLIEDVITTGATLGACAIQLMQAGAKSVAVLAVARSLTFHKYRHAIFKKYGN